MARSVEDAALIYRVLSGPDPRDPQTLAWTPADPLPALRRGVAGLRIAVMPDASARASTATCSPPTTRAVDTLAKLGARDRPARAAASLQRLRRRHRPHHRRRGLSLRRAPGGRREPARRSRTSGRGSSSAATCRRATTCSRSRRWRSDRRAYNAALAGVDALLTPTSLDPAPADRSGRSGGHRRPLHAAGELPGPLRPRRAGRLHAGRPAAVAPDRLPGGRGGDGAAHRLGLRGRDDVEGPAAAGGAVMSPATLPLGRYTVLDLTRARAGPTCVRQLVDWGATRHQDRDAGRAHGRRHGRQPPRVRFPEPAPQQEEHHAQPARARGRDHLQAAGAGRRHRGGELPPRREAPARHRLREPAPDQPAADLRQHLRLRAGRAVSRSARRRSDRAGHGRPHVDHRHSGTGAGARRHPHRGPLLGHLPRPGHPRGAASSARSRARASGCTPRCSRRCCRCSTSRRRAG